MIENATITRITVAPQQRNQDTSSTGNACEWRPTEAYHFGFEISTAGRRSDNVKRFTMFLTYLSAKGLPQGVPIEISWNPAAGRFQEFAPDELDPPGYKKELANSPTRKGQ